MCRISTGNRGDNAGPKRRSPFFHLLTLALVLGIGGCPEDRHSDSESHRNSNVDSAKPETISTAEVVRFCGDCHAYPKPKTFPRDVWRKEVEQGFHFYELSGRTDLEQPNRESVVAYYESAAPESLKLRESRPVAEQKRIRFVPTSVDLPVEMHPAVADLHWSAPGPEDAGKLYFCDMFEGRVSQLTFDGRTGFTHKPLLAIPNPAHVEPVDLDSDGRVELLISDLGSFQPEDHNRGQLVLTEERTEHPQQDFDAILKGVGRIADAKAGDLDGDGDFDLVVAEFGWRRTGKLRILRNDGASDSRVRYQNQIVDDRHGFSHVSIVDIDGDEDLDFVAMVSQEFESILLFINDGSGAFEDTVLFSADNPAYGLSGMEVSDLDGDNDFDILFVNGDSMDSHMLKPYHSVQWLEQTTPGQFVYRFVDTLPGVYAAKPRDLDNDGDLDLVACTMTWDYEHPANCLVWYEQTAVGEYERHDLEYSANQHACLEIGDFDGDGDPDIAVGHFEIRPVKSARGLTIWWNEGRIANESN